MKYYFCRIWDYPYTNPDAFFQQGGKELWDKAWKEFGAPNGNVFSVPDERTAMRLHAEFQKVPGFWARTLGEDGRIVAPYQIIKE